MILFFTYWFPPVHRGRIIAGFMTAIPISIALGAPVSTSIMELNGFLGLAGWKWLFLIEAAPAVLLGVSCLLFLTDRPEKASWLAADEKAWLAGELQKEQRQLESVRAYTLWQSLYNPRVLALALIYFGIAAASVGLVMFLAQIVKELGLSNLMTGLRVIDPLCGRYARDDRRWVRNRPDGRAPPELRRAVPVRCDRAGAGRIDARHLVVDCRLVDRDDRLLRHETIVLADAVAVPDRHRSRGRDRLDQCARQPGGYDHPWIVGTIKDATGSFAGGLFALSAFALMSAIVTLIGVPSNRQQARYTAAVRTAAE